MDYHYDMDDFDGEFPPEMYYDDPDFMEVADMLQSGWLSPEHPEAERMHVFELVQNCLIPTMSQAFSMVMPLIVLCFLSKIICTFATQPLYASKMQRKLSNSPRPSRNGSPLRRNDSPDRNIQTGCSNAKSPNRNSPNSTQCQSVDMHNNGNDIASSNGYTVKNGNDNNTLHAPEHKSLKEELFKENNKLMPVSVVHVTSILFGLFALYIFVHWNIVYLLILVIMSYCTLLLAHKQLGKYCGPIVTGILAVYIILCELFIVERSNWHQIRGAGMIMCMKIISVGFDLDAGMIQMPKIHEYMGYTFNVASVIFGPWISFQDYLAVELQHKYKISIRWAVKCILSFFGAMLCLTVSTCFVHWLILDGSSKWFLAYRDAQSFRFSHYFVSYLSELTLVCAGLGAVGTNGNTKWDVTVARPHFIEIPRSLVEVVTNWNLPMHYWLKTYVFRAARPLGKFLAIILTYAASSLLHGLNFQLAAVLFSLGFYSYVEFILRQKLAKIFNACIEAKKCKEDCEHTYKWLHPAVIVTNVLFCMLTIFHLAYLGLMFDSSDQEGTGYSMKHTLSKWANLDYASHWVALGTLVFCWLI